jgi:hypothetical protein
MSAQAFEGSPASVDLLRRGQGLIVAASQTLAVADPAITANSLVVAVLGTLGDGTVSAQVSVAVWLAPATGFTLKIPANAAATGQQVNWAVLKY